MSPSLGICFLLFFLFFISLELSAWFLPNLQLCNLQYHNFPAYCIWNTHCNQPVLWAWDSREKHTEETLLLIWLLFSYIPMAWPQPVTNAGSALTPHTAQLEWDPWVSKCHRASAGSPGLLSNSKHSQMDYFLNFFFLFPFFFPHAYPLTLETCNLKAFSNPQTIALMHIRPFSGEAPALPEGMWAVPVASAVLSLNPNWIVHFFFQQNSKGRFKTELTLNKCN